MSELLWARNRVTELEKQLQAADALAKAIKFAVELDNNYRGLREWVAIEEALGIYEKAREV